MSFLNTKSGGRCYAKVNSINNQRLVYLNRKLYTFDKLATKFLAEMVNMDNEIATVGVVKHEEKVLLHKKVCHARTRFKSNFRFLHDVFSSAKKKSGKIKKEIISYLIFLSLSVTGYF